MIILKKYIISIKMTNLMLAHQEDQEKSISRLVGAICLHRATTKEIEQLAQIAVDHAVVFLRMLEGRGYRIRETQSEKEFQGIAADSVASLFLPQKARSALHLAAMIDSRIGEGMEDQAIYLLFRQIIRFKVRQHLSEIYRQRDPESARLLRNIRLSVRRQPALSLRRDVTGQYICYAPGLQRAGIFRPSFEEVQRAAASAIHVSESVDVTVLKIAQSLAEETDRDIEINVFYVLPVLRALHNRTKLDQSAAVAALDVDAIQRQELDGYMKKTLERLNQKPVQRYVTAGKLNYQEAAALLLALEELCSEMLRGESPSQHFNLVKKYWKDLTREIYAERIEKILEYLILQLRQDLQSVYKKIF